MSKMTYRQVSLTYVLCQKKRSRRGKLGRLHHIALRRREHIRIAQCKPSGERSESIRRARHLWIGVRSRRSNGGLAALILREEKTEHGLDPRSVNWEQP
jgi:hypothetical protein